MRTDPTNFYALGRLGSACGSLMGSRRRMTLSFQLLLPSCVWAGAFLAPQCAEDPSTPTLAVFSTGHAAECVIHAVVYPNGKLIWVNKYRKFAWPKPFSQSDTDLSSIFTVKSAQIDTSEVLALVAQIRAHRPLAEYLEHPFGVPMSFPAQNIVFADHGEHLEMVSGHEFSNDLLLKRIANPSATPVPLTHDQQTFVQDWDFIKGLMFDLVDRHAAEGVAIGPLHFKEVDLKDGM
jgi:hypothetical protein